MSAVIWMLECRSIDDTALMSAPPAILVTSSVPIRRIHQLDEETELVAPLVDALGGCSRCIMRSSDATVLGASSWRQMQRG
jgi:hypothetical protein